MRIVTVRIEDNTDKIHEIQTMRKSAAAQNEALQNDIKRAQEEAFLQILAYVRCATEDYIGIVGEVTPINSVSWVKNYLRVSACSRSVFINANSKEVVIGFDFSGTPYCKNTPQDMKARFNNDHIEIIESTERGIHELIRHWKYLKPEFQKEIDRAYFKQKNNLQESVSGKQYILDTAKNFNL